MIINFENKQNRIWFFTTKVLSFFLVLAMYSLIIIGALRVEAKVQSEKDEKAAYSNVQEFKSLFDHDYEYKDIVLSMDDFLTEQQKPANYESILENLAEFKDNEVVDIEEIDLLEGLSDVTDEEIEDTDDIDISDENASCVDLEGESSNDGEDETPDILEPNLNDWELMLINKQNPVPDGYEASLANIDSSYKADKRIIDSIYKMMEASNNDGVNLNICSAYRSYDRQISLFNNKINKLMKQGMNYMDAYAVGSMSVTVPGTSEHQVGLALDILSDSYYEMDDGFGDTPEGIWLAENAPDYGFILRYPKGKEDITGIIYEPWHFRYVGIDYAKQITELGICLEEYLNGEY